MFSLTVGKYFTLIGFEIEIVVVYARTHKTHMCMHFGVSQFQIDVFVKPTNCLCSVWCKLVVNPYSEDAKKKLFVVSFLTRFVV